MAKTLPARRYHRTPRPLMSDAYTVNGYIFESPQASEKSVYYATFRKPPTKHEPAIYSADDDRMLFAGLQALCDILFYEPVTHAEIDESVAFHKGRKATTKGFEDFEFPEALWRRVVDEYEGYIPIAIDAMPEGSVIYPGEPFLRVTAPPGFAALVPWFESTLLHVWSASERLTAARHAYKWAYNLIRSVELPEVPDSQCELWARLMIHDFGDRGAACPQESELVAKMHNLVFYGTDTWRAAYQNWKNGAPPAFGSSVKALAHRIVQGFENEFDCYETMYNTANNGELLSMVSDCYDHWNALHNAMIPLAQRSVAEGNGKIVVIRPDSGDSLEMVLGAVKAAHEAGLSEPVNTTMGPMQAATTFRFIVGNGENFESVRTITEALLAEGFATWRWGVFGLGGSLRNNLTRDHMSTKFALCEVGEDSSWRPVIKLSEEKGKQTLPAGCLTVRDEEALRTGVTIVYPNEGRKSAFVNYYWGAGEAPFGSGFTEDFLTIENRVMREFDKMPKKAGKRTESVEGITNVLSKKYRSTTRERV